MYVTQHMPVRTARGNRSVPVSCKGRTQIWEDWRRRGQMGTVPPQPLFSGQWWDAEAPAGGADALWWLAAL